MENRLLIIILLVCLGFCQCKPSFEEESESKKVDILLISMKTGKSCDDFQEIVESHYNAYQLLHDVYSIDPKAIIKGVIPPSKVKIRNLVESNSWKMEFQLLDGKYRLLSKDETKNFSSDIIIRKK